MSALGTVSVVIPTRNRPASLGKVLQSLDEQTYPLHEIIVLDASDDADSTPQIDGFSNRLSIQHERCKPHLCRQRNTGIKRASGDFVFLCDDDIEFPGAYVEEILNSINDSGCGAGTGLIMEAGPGGTFAHGAEFNSPFSLLWTYLFQLGVWADSRVIREKFPKSRLVRFLLSSYARKGNTITSAGWPLVTQISEPFFRTTIYGLGASIVRREWLLESPFDERLESHGIGDNFGVALGFPGILPILVRSDLHVRHNRAPENRPPRESVYFSRVLALDYFMKVYPGFSLVNHLSLIWSILGHYLALLLRGESTQRKSAGKAFRAVLFKENPYIRKG